MITGEDVNDKAEEFKNFIASVGRETFEKSKNDSTNTYIASDNVKSLPNTDNLVTHNLIKPKPVAVETVILTIPKLKETTSTSVGSVGISLRFIKDSLFVTAFCLTCLTNTSIVTGKFPAPWKHAIVVPIF